MTQPMLFDADTIPTPQSLCVYESCTRHGRAMAWPQKMEPV